MAFSRAVAPVSPPEADTLTEDMAGIGMNLGGRANHRANIENTLFFASEEGMDRADYRVLSILVTWLGVHGSRVNVDRLARLIGAGGSKRVRAFWAAVGLWLAKDRRFSRLIRFHSGKPIDLLDVGAEFQVRRHGEDRRFEGSALRVPANILRDRPADVMTPGQLARNHRAYSWRVAIGPTFRADMWAEMEGTAGLKAAEIARKTYGSFATAWQAKRDWEVWVSGRAS